MKIRTVRICLLAGLWPACLVLSSAAAAESALQTPVDSVRIEQVADGLQAPWALAFLPDGEFLITERGGKLWHFHAGGRQQVSGVPAVVARGQGGLLDAVAARDFAETRMVFLSYSAAMDGGAGTALAVARLSDAGDALEELRVIFTMKNASSAGRHFGSRIVEAPDGNLFLTIGDRADRDSAQSLQHHSGKVIRIARDGSVPADNPFVGNADALPEIWSYGHRNAQGAALDLNGNLLLNEHGARGGDEVNVVRAGANYGWPVIAYGRHYWGGKIGEGTAKAGMEQPAYYWDPSLAPSGMMVYSGKLWPEWRGDVFVGSLKFNYIARLRPGAEWAEVGQIAAAETLRVRDVREASDGSIWFLSVGKGAVYRVVPGGAGG